MDYLRSALAPAAMGVAGALLCWSAATAQISPGDLSAPHVSLEGIGNCTKCHELGNEVTNARCLDCHTELRARLKWGKGYHAPLSGRRCAECHNEHHGRNFMLVRLDRTRFNHVATGYVLEGKHRTLECETCHTRDHITAKDVRANRALLNGRTFLGLSADCSGCHSDRHSGQLSAQCQSCHTPEGWKPAIRFVHDRAKYRLNGKHVQVACARCHRPMAADAGSVQYVGLRFEACSSCHADPHGGRFRKPCESCHTTAGWESGGARNFDHATTRFPLRGEHASVRCELCHVPVRGPDGKLEQNFTIRNFRKCADCHADAHRGEFAQRKEGSSCEACHTVEGWQKTTFVHATTRYALAGKHAALECGKCHGEVTVDARGRRVPPDLRVKRFSACADCHEDAHAGQFRRRKGGVNCEPCHTVGGFLPSSFSLADHNASGFPLEGGHEAVPCGRCHALSVSRGRSTRQFTWTPGPQCQTCHRDPHGGQFARTRHAACVSCHSPKGWIVLAFNHAETNFPLSGKHVHVACVECHRVIGGAGGGRVRQFAGTPVRCVDCHAKSERQSSRAGRQ